MKTGKGAGPELYVRHSHLLSHIVLVHIRIDLQELVSSAGELRPGNGHTQLSIVGVSVDIIRV